ncbi:DEAD/DEAH box helicase [Marinitenerispora sediminis]|uniref:DEAD/DEAH box helicase n=2 Tax=Marinitenerispora sediminis TaxID=1931232 RepID=UPI0021624964|nr:DEAD/DEAH box helicase [Marinitenerispora sediminis]
MVRPADPPRAARIAFWDPAGGAPPTGLGEPGDLTVVLPDGADGVRPRTVPARWLPVSAALPLLVRAATAPGAHPAAAFWGGAAVAALRLIARGHVRPDVTPAGHDAWRVAPADPADAAHLHALAAAMPPEARAVPVPDRAPPELRAAAPLLRAFCDAVADTLPRRPGTDRPFASVEPRQVPALREWAAEAAAGAVSGPRVSLRLELPGGTDALAADGDGPEFRAVVQVHGVADPALVIDAEALAEGIGAEFGPQPRIDTIRAVRHAAGVWPPLERLLHRPLPDACALSDAEVADLLAGAAARLAAAGVDVHWPRDLAPALTATATLGADGPPPAGTRAFLGGAGDLRLDWRMALDGTPLTDAEVDRLAAAHRPVVHLRGRWTLVPPDLAGRARDRRPRSLTGLAALDAALTGTAEVAGERVTVAPSGWLAELRDRLADPDGGREQVGPPAGLAADLRGYQLRGLRWLVRMTSLGLGCCLADDMGLGKTITLIALHLHQRAAGTAGATLVVCPASLLGNWRREIERFAPGVAVRTYHGARRDLDGVTDGFVLTTYGTMRRDAARLGALRWGLLVADEAQHVKNPASGTARALRTVGADARVALSGTPIENNLSELWAILDWTTPGLLGTLPAFRARWAAPIEAGRDPVAAERLSRLVRPFLLRRRKTDPGVAPELPPKTETDRPVTLTLEQAGLYEAVVRDTMERIRTADGMARRGLVFGLLTALKQICDHPAQYLREDSGRLAGRSGKLDLLDELLDTITAAGGSVLVFTQYVAMAKLLERHLTERGLPCLLLHGGTPVPRRDELVRRFQAGEAPVLLLSLRAAGTGLNLTRADHVVHYDRWWNPAVEDQATDRAYRIGQTRPVQVHRLIAEGTVEDRIAAMLAGKRELADAVLRSGEAALSELSDAELAALVELRAAPGEPEPEPEPDDTEAPSATEGEQR